MKTYKIKNISKTAIQLKSKRSSKLILPESEASLSITELRDYNSTIQAFKRYLSVEEYKEEPVAIEEVEVEEPVAIEEVEVEEVQATKKKVTRRGRKPKVQE